MSRNQKIEIKNEQGIRRYKTEILALTPSTTDTVIQITSADRLDKLSQEFYGTPDLWWVIATLNQIKGSYVVSSNTIIRIPQRDRVFDFIEQLNKTR
jgi:hypothetical protein